MEIDFSNLRSEKITDFHCLETFYSGVEAMDKFIQGDFRMSVENHYCSAYGVWYKEELVAIYALIKVKLTMFNERFWAGVFASSILFATFARPK